ncbi:MAG: AAA family ATPase [Ignavibacteria bacterium]
MNKSSERILVIGCPGSGKSTFSKNLGSILNIEVIHLDKYFHKPGWVESTKEEWNETVKKLIAKDKWIMDGNYTNTLGIRAQRADEILFFDYSSLFCIYRIFKRILKTKLNLQVRDDMAEGCSEKWFDWEFVKFTWNFYEKGRISNFKILDELNFNKKNLKVFKNAGEAKLYIKNLNYNVN